MFPANISLLHIGRDKRRRRVFCCRSDASCLFMQWGRTDLWSQESTRGSASTLREPDEAEIQPDSKINCVAEKNQVRNKCFSVCSELFAKKEATATFHLLSFYLQPSRRYSDYQHVQHVSVCRSSVSLEATNRRSAACKQHSHWMNEVRS